MNWPIGAARDFKGVYDRMNKECLIFHKASTGGAQKAEIAHHALTSPKIAELLGKDAVDKLTEELELLDMAGNAFCMQDFLEGTVTPVFFASALTNFGIEPFFDAFIHLAPSPQPRLVDGIDGQEITVDPVETPFSGYVFKLQANMDRRHRDSMAFLRICSGRFERDLIVKHHRLSARHSLIKASRHGSRGAYNP